MEQSGKSKFVVVQEGNRRATAITAEEIKQCLGDIEAWFSKNGQEVYSDMKNAKPATSDEIKKLADTIKDKVSSTLESLLVNSHPYMLLRDLFKTMTVAQILDAIEVNQVNGYWKKNYIPFANDDDNNYLCLENSNGVDSKVVSWCTDMGVIEEISDSLGMLLEKLRDDLLRKKLQYVDGAGLIEKTD